VVAELHDYEIDEDDIPTVRGRRGSRDRRRRADRNGRRPAAPTAMLQPRRHAVLAGSRSWRRRRRGSWRAWSACGL